MKILVIDSHKSTKRVPANNLHWINANQIALSLNADIIWSYKGVNDRIIGGYDAIIFVHASHYSFVDKAWLDASPNARLFYVTNEYNLGEPRILWMAAKEGRKYEVIANHPSEASKVVMKYVNRWHQVNLNALCVDPTIQIDSNIERCKTPIYYGSFRKDRAKYFQMYLDSVIVSTHKKNHSKFLELGVIPNFIPRIDWSKDGLSKFMYSLYIEDEKTHTHYNYLANRFYEALNYEVVSLFDKSCIGTIQKSGYPIGSQYIINSPSDLVGKLKEAPPFPLSWKTIALREKERCLEQIEDIVTVLF